jgi:hypothetical protein
LILLKPLVSVFFVKVLKLKIKQAGKTTALVLGKTNPSETAASGLPEPVLAKQK